MLVTALIDTGPILALVNRRDPWHRLCRDAFAQLHYPLLTSEAVLAEVFHLLKRVAVDASGAWSIIRSRAITLGAITDSDLPELHSLMSQYSDRSMDFADATLVLLARRHKLTTIFTTDHDDFETYRIDGTKKFRIVPARQP